MFTFRFLREFITSPGRVGALAPSSRALAECICAKADVPEASYVVEFGPGTGAITKVIAERLAESARFFAMEINPEFVRILREQQPDVKVVEDSCVNLRKYLAEDGNGHCDRIISGVPFAAFGDQLQNDIIDAVLGALEPGGKFTAFGYVQGRWLPQGRAIRRKLFDRFSVVEQCPIVWKNLPPAQVYCATK